MTTAVEDSTAVQHTYYVKDNGLGISAAGQARVFLPFQRLHPQVGVPGEGMGLAIIHRVVECQGGRIWLESTVGQGTTFFVALPAVPAEKTSPSSPSLLSPTTKESPR